MNRPWPVGVRLLYAVTMILSVAVPIFAALGGTEDSVAADQAKFHASRKVVAERGFSVHAISEANGTEVREYVAPSGKVFAVTWKGPTLPDLPQLLGASFQEFQTSLHAKRSRKTSAVVRNPDLVVESTGHMRAFYGRAYLKSLLPNGMTPEAIQ